MNGRQYRCIATNDVATRTSNAVTLTVNAGTGAPFVAVTSITGVPTAATAGTPLTLTGTVTPTNATNQTIVWSVANAGSTGASISGNTLNTTAAGAAQVRATITNGATASTNYTQDFTITVSPAGTTPTPVLSVSPASLTFSGANENQMFSITSNTGWTITGVAAWLTVYPTSGNGDATITVTSTANTTLMQRTSTITVSGTGVASRTVSVTQDDIATSIETVQSPSALQAYAQGGVLYVSGLTEGATVRVYSIMGMLVYHGIANSDKAVIPLSARGIYIVTDGKSVVKVVN